MTGVKGRSGGARAGAGRPKKAAPERPPVSGYTDPLQFLQAVWTGELEASVAQVRAATAALPFKHRKLGEGGKADLNKGAAEAAATGKYSPRTGPPGAMKH